MAFVSEFFRNVEGHSARAHSTCSCGWRTADRKGTTVLQLDTYGSDQRQDTGTVSQSIQLDEAGARELVGIIQTVFPDV